MGIVFDFFGKTNMIYWLVLHTGSPDHTDGVIHLNFLTMATHKQFIQIIRILEDRESQQTHAEIAERICDILDEKVAKHV